MKSTDIEKKLGTITAKLSALETERAALLDAQAEAELGGPAADGRRLLSIVGEIANAQGLRDRIASRLEEAQEREATEAREELIEVTVKTTSAAVDAVGAATTKAAKGLRDYLALLDVTTQGRETWRMAAGRVPGGLNATSPSDLLNAAGLVLARGTAEQLISQLEALAAASKSFDSRTFRTQLEAAVQAELDRPRREAEARRRKLDAFAHADEEDRAAEARSAEIRAEWQEMHEEELAKSRRARNAILRATEPVDGDAADRVARGAAASILENVAVGAPCEAVDE